MPVIALNPHFSTPILGHAPFTWSADPRIKYMIYQIEKAPETGQWHAQGTVCWKNACWGSAISALLEHDPHLEPCADVAASIEYCRKSRTRELGPWEVGHAPVEQA